MLTGQRQDVRAAGLPEIVGEAAVQVVPDAYDEGLKEGARLSAGPGQRAQEAAPGAGPQAFEPGRGAEREYVFGVDEGGPRRQGVGPGAKTGARREGGPVEGDADELAAHRFSREAGLPGATDFAGGWLAGGQVSGAGLASGRRWPVIHAEAASGGDAGAVGGQGRRQFQVPAGHAAGGLARVGGYPAFVGERPQPGRLREARAEAGRDGFRTAMRDGSEAQARGKGRHEEGSAPERTH